MQKINVVTLSPDHPNTILLEASSLRQKCEEVPDDVIGTTIFCEIVTMMFGIMYQNDGAGLAASQVGIQWRMATIHPSDDSIGPTVIINPKVVEKSEEEEEAIEACISLPNCYGKVPRSKRILIESRNIHNELQTHDLQGWLARLFQHELDHFDGILYPLRMKKISDLQYQDLYSKRAEIALKKLY